MASFTTTADFPTDADLTLGIINIRIDSTTNSVQISTTGATIDVLYTVKLCNSNTHSFSATSSSLTGVSTTPVSLYSSVIDTTDKFAEIQIFNLTYLTTYIITAACTYNDPLYAIAIAKLY
jgi:hypothetical protein